MVMWGSDYLLGLSTFAPEEFARRDRLWADADPRFHELNDVLQYLGAFAFPLFGQNVSKLYLTAYNGIHVTRPSISTASQFDVLEAAVQPSAMLSPLAFTTRPHNSMRAFARCSADGPAVRFA